MMLKRDVTFALAWLMTWPALAQTTTPAPTTPAPTAPAPAAPTAPSTGTAAPAMGLDDYWWLVLLVLIVAAALWYFSRRRRGI
ncbi:hypothetical protein [Enterovirga sp. CN4-39]|uniref:hypothetical protein n=1 Tax=Enterovirga sp. CN4-39 TaxID=3400910 RepID=UPI003BFFADE8